MDFDTVLITDSRIEQINDKCTFAIKSGPSSSTFQSFEAVSKSVNTITHNVNVPSESIVVDRNVSILNELTFEFSFVTTAGIPVSTDAQTAYLRADFLKLLNFNSFPFNSLVNTIQCNINNTSLSINLNDLKPFLTHLMNKEELQKYNGLCPTLDPVLYTSGVYTDALHSVNRLYSESYVGSLFGNSTVRIKEIKSNTTNILLVAGTGANLGKILLQNQGAAIATGSTIKLLITIETIEPIMLSPFIFNGLSQYNNAGLVGINTFNMVFNLDPSASRAINIFQTEADVIDLGDVACNNVAYANTNLQLYAIGKSQIQCCFLSLQPSQLIQSKNSVPYIDYPRYITSASNSVIPSNSSLTITSNSLQLNQIPDYILIGIRPTQSNITVKKQHRFYPIKQLNINFNNVSGLLSSATEYDLYKMSVKNGLQKTYLDFTGYAPDASFGTLGGGVLGSKLQQTSGSFIVIDPSLDLSLPDFYSNGSIGVFSFQVSAIMENRTGSDIPANSVELVIVCCNAGIFNTVQGSSNTNTGVLNKEIVMNTKSQQSQNSMSSSIYQRLVGGSLSNSIGSAMRKIAPTRANVVASSSSNVRSKPFKAGLDQFV